MESASDSPSVKSFETGGMTMANSVLDVDEVDSVIKIVSSTPNAPPPPIMPTTATATETTTTTIETIETKALLPLALPIELPLPPAIVKTVAAAAPVNIHDRIKSGHDNDKENINCNVNTSSNNTGVAADATFTISTDANFTASDNEDNSGRQSTARRSNIMPGQKFVAVAAMMAAAAEHTTHSTEQRRNATSTSRSNTTPTTPTATIATTPNSRKMRNNSSGSILKKARTPLVHVSNNTINNPALQSSINKRKKVPIKFRPLINTTGTDRLTREFRDVKCAGMPQVRELKLCENSIYHWKFLLLPDKPPYNKYAFHAEIQFPPTYPQMAPMITVHHIYHPNVDEKGYVCLHCLSHWSRTLKVEDVFQKLFALIRDPEPHHPMRFDVADEYLKDRKVFMLKAFEAAKALGVHRPKF